MKKAATTLLTEGICASETSVAFSRLHSDISQKIELLITAAIRTSDPTNSMVFA
jgi:hypothetical protein